MAGISHITIDVPAWWNIYDGGPYARAIDWLCHALVRPLILIWFLLLPCAALAEDGTALPLSKIVLYSSGVGYFQTRSMAC